MIVSLIRQIRKTTGILGRYILREHIGPFIFALIVTIFVLVIDLVPNIVDLIIGKNLDALTVLWVFCLNLAWMIALAIPMATLISTLMAFGRFSSDFEILSMKASGVNVLRMILPVLICATFLAGGLVWFNNAVLPEANHKSRVLMGDIRVMRPTLSIKSNIFINDIPGYFILIGDVDHETSRIEDVLIYDRRVANLNRTITADHGYLEFLENGQVLSFELEDGQTYESDLKDPGVYKRVLFKKLLYNIRDVSRELRKTESSHRSDREMSTAQMLSYTKALGEDIEQFREESEKLVLNFGDPNKILHGMPENDVKRERISEAGIVIDALTDLRNTKTKLMGNLRKISQLKKTSNVYLLEVHKKFSIPAACIVFVLIGAPLGILARRGSMGAAIGISVGLFIVYWAFLIGGEELSDRGITSPVLAMWLPNILIGAIGLVLLYRVITEKSLFQIMSAIRRSAVGVKLSNWLERTGKLFMGELEKKKAVPRSKALPKRRLGLLKVLDGYLLGKFVRAVILSLIIFVIVTHLVSLIEHLDTYIDRKAGIVDIISFYIYYTPFIIVLTIPIATLLGAIFTIGLMARKNELLAIKASGVSLWRIAFPLMMVGLFISIAVFAASEKVLPYTNQKKSEIRYSKIEKNPTFREEYHTDFHVRGDYGRIFNFQLYSPKQLIGKEVQIDTYSGIRRKEILEARQMIWKDTVWLATDVKKTIFSDPNQPAEKDSIVTYDSLYLNYLTETPDRFARRKIDPRDFGYDQPIKDLKDEIANKERNSIDATTEKVFLMFKYSLPLTSFIIILIAVPLAADPRRGSPAVGFAFAIAISFTYMILFEVFRTLGTSGKIPPPFAAWSINAIFFLVGLIMMIKARK